MTQLTVDQAMQLAIRNHQAGRLAEAEEIYRRVLIQQPNHPDALHLLGVIARQCGRSNAAIELIQQAIAIKPTVADYYNNLSVALSERALFDEAIAALRQAISLNPDLAGATLQPRPRPGKNGPDRRGDFRSPSSDSIQARLCRSL